MWPIIFSFSKGISVFTTGIVIKMMDDYLDQEMDAILGYRKNPLLGSLGILPYTLLLFSIGCILDAKTSTSLFLASYAIGMSSSLTAVMPTGLKGFHESIIVSVLGLIAFGMPCYISSVLIIQSLQFLDDILDYEKDFSQKHNWVCVLGKGETLILFCMFFLGSFLFDEVKTLFALMSYFLINHIIVVVSEASHAFVEREGKTQCHKKF